MKRLRIALFCLLPVLAQTQVSSDPPVTIRYVEGSISIDVNTKASLETVLQHFCRATKAECSGAEYCRSLNVAALSLRGSWEDVVEHLMSGTQLNYVSRAPYGNSKGKLLIEPRSALGREMPTAPPSANSPQPSYLPSQQLASGTSDGETETAPSDNANTSEYQRQEFDSASAPTHAPALAASSQSGVRGSPLTSDMPAASSAEPPGGSPFPDSLGRPLPASELAPQFLPFPDSKGQLIPAKPSQPGMPFPSHPALKGKN
jgi:hypothetical protein